MRLDAASHLSVRDVGSYDPNSDVQPNEIWDTTFLSDRDVSAQVPVNFVPHPSVYLSKACFGLNKYEDNAAESCLSNLLSSQIQRYVIDIYWDTINLRFGLCPVEIPVSSEGASELATSEGEHTVKATVTAAAASTSAIKGRQATPTLNSDTTATVSPNTTTSATTASYTILSSGGNSQIFQLGPYQCSNTLTLASITSVFSDYMDRTANTLDAKLIIWVLNLHVASTVGSPTTPRDRIPASQLPNVTSSVRTYLDSFSDVLYTPGTLLSDRQNLNAWYRRSSRDQLPANNYFTTYDLGNGDKATENGWPDEDYIQIAKGNRLLVGFGRVDDALAGYNTSEDGDRIYPPGYIFNLREASFQADGELESGCYYNSNEYSVAQLNNSWAVTAINSVNPPNLDNVADNLTTCGISQLLNVTLDGITADQNPMPYQQFGNNAIFSWAYGEPQNDSSPGIRNDQEFRCALMVSDNNYRGHWRVAYCNQQYRVACREADSPYLWRISGYSVPFDSAEAACTGNTSFGVPRTGLENTYLYNKVLNDAQQDKTLLNGIWINFNSLSVENCWITTGLNGSCPYYQDSSATHSRQILIPAIAALIVLILTVLTVLVKCGGNVRNSRVRKRGEGGWDYEGVPS